MFLVNIYIINQEHIYNSWGGGEHIETDFFPLNYKLVNEVSFLKFFLF